MENITYDRAVEIKSFLDSIGDFLPDSKANELWKMFLEVYNPAFREAPCTCSPREWVNIINKLKADMATIIDSNVQTPVQEEIVQPVADLTPSVQRKAKK